MHGQNHIKHLVPFTHQFAPSFILHDVRLTKISEIQLQHPNSDVCFRVVPPAAAVSLYAQEASVVFLYRQIFEDMPNTITLH